MTDPTPTLKAVIQRAEREHIKLVLSVTEGHRGYAAKLLGISRKNLWEKCRRLGIAHDAGEVTP